jgi:hypothetical protein
MSGDTTGTKGDHCIAKSGGKPEDEPQIFEAKQRTGGWQMLI